MIFSFYLWKTLAVSRPRSYFICVIRRRKIFYLCIVFEFQNTSSHEGQIRFLVYTLENAVLNLPEGQEKMVWLIDFTGWTMANAVPIKTARETTNILQNHYPERLAVAFLFNPPKVFEAFWKVKALSLSPMLCMSIFTNIVRLTKYIQVHSKKYLQLFKTKNTE